MGMKPQARAGTSSGRARPGCHPVWGGLGVAIMRESQQGVNIYIYIYVIVAIVV